MRKAIDWILSIIIVAISIYIFINREEVITYIARKYSTYKVHEVSNNYSKKKDFMEFKRTDDFTPTNKAELKNVIYTILDDGMDEFTFYCDYKCENDIREIINGDTLGIINNYIHPYNSYETFNIAVNNFDVVTISIEKNYTEAEKRLINSKIVEAKNEVIKSNMNDYQKVKAFHDYIIKNTRYNETEAKQIENSEKTNLTSHKAYAVFNDGTGVCGGYSDALAIFLNFMGIDNFKVSTVNHVWNAVYVDGKWQHVDVTWDDPVVSDGSEMLIYDYFMVSSDELIKLDTERHVFNKELYLELN